VNNWRAWYTKQKKIRGRSIGSRGTAKIRAILTDVHAALLEKKIDRFRLWNLDELAREIQADARFGKEVKNRGKFVASFANGLCYLL
jgi:hypothetical protein